ncbi:PhoU domain-containing protein [uncultured Thiodictyon sp.]|uniref:phosphate signaling complex PhoU family protein n=1 Tax=uncultured Thiodictyon sp. TaxID=1846217 RepID=UPI0025E9EB01|nr:PhoU domain-containing protein [uncultured Thiodictyon sp.]
MTEAEGPVVRTNLVNGHTVRAYDRELTRLRGLIIEMGERVVEQTQGAVAALLGEDLSNAYRVLDREPQIDYLALDADEEVFRVIARRQPTAVDLRVVLALARIAGEAERAADKAARIARGTLDFRADDTALPPSIGDGLRAQGERVCCAVQRSIAAVAQFDSELALVIFENEPGLIEASHTVHLALCSPAQTPLPPAKIGALFNIAHALEHIGRHAGAIAEQVIYVAEGQDVRFRNREILIEALRHRPG